MSDRTDGGRPVRNSSRPRWFATVESRFIPIIGCLIVIFGVIIGGHLYGRFLSARDLGGRDTAIEQLQTQAQNLKRQLDDKSAQLTSLQDKLTTAQAALDSIMPAQNTYSINPNQSLIVADGHLTIGLIGPPANEAVTLNINGKQQQLVSGQVFDVSPDRSTNCQVTVQSFDMFKAVVNASCAGAKPQ